MKQIHILIIALLVFNLSAAQENFYNLEAKTITGENFKFDQLEGKKILIVNTASECGLTPQYEGLEELHQKYGGDDFIIIGFPANNFMNQEPGSNEEIIEFCEKNYGVSFTMMEKISVKGDDMHPVYQWLTQEEKNGKESSNVKWNFQKYLIDESGNLTAVFNPRTKPTDPEIIKHLEQ